jgi:hypothetical protein
VNSPLHSLAKGAISLPLFYTCSRDMLDGRCVGLWQQLGYEGLKREASFWIAVAMADEGWLNVKGVPLLMA